MIRRTRSPGQTLRPPVRPHSDDGGERPFRVLLTTDTLGGVWTYAVELTRGLARQGVEVVVASMGDLPGPSQRKDLDVLPGVRLVDSGFRLEWMPGAWEEVHAAGQWLLSLERQVDPDVIHLNDYAHGALPFRAPTLVVGHSCVCSWWEAVHGEPAPPSRDRYRQEVARGLRGADLVVAPTRAMLEAMVGHYGPLPRSRVVPNGRTPPAPTPGNTGAPRTNGDRADRTAIRDDVVLACGRLWDEAKNLTVLEQVAPELPWPVRVAGACRHPDGGTATAQQVELLGRLAPEEVLRQMGRAGIFVHPARYEPFGLAPLEAALSGCALVLGDIPSLREVWGNAADFADPTDPCAVAGAVNRLIRNPEQRSRRARAAMERARKLSPDAMTTAYLELYHDLVDRQRATAKRQAVRSSAPSRPALRPSSPSAPPAPPSRRPTRRPSASPAQESSP